MSNTQDFKDNEGSSSTSDTSNSAYEFKASSTNPFTRRQMIVGGGSLAGVAAAGIASRGQAQTQPPQKNNTNEKVGTGRLSGKVAFITGAARGIGSVTALTLAQEGADIFALDIADPEALKGTLGYPLATSEELQQTQRLVQKTGQRCLTMQADVRSLVERTRIILPNKRLTTIERIRSPASQVQNCRA